MSRGEHFQEGAGTLRREIAQGPHSSLLPGHAPTGHAAPWSMTSHLPCWPCGEHTTRTAGRRVASQSVGPPLASLSCLPSPTSALSITLAHNIPSEETVEN